MQTEPIHCRCLLKPFPGQYSLLQCPVSFSQDKEDKQPAQGAHMPRTGCVIVLSQFTKQKHSVSLHLIRKLARRPGWSGFSYTGVRHVLSFASSCHPDEEKRERRENNSGAFPCLNVTLCGAGHWELQPDWAPLNKPGPFQSRELHLVAAPHTSSF